MYNMDRAEEVRTLLPGDLSPSFQDDGSSSRSKLRSYVEKAFHQGWTFFEWKSQTLDGIPFPTEILMSRIDLPEGPVLQALVRDNTERKANERALRRQAEGEALVQAISADLLGASINDLDDTLQHALSRLGGFIGADRAYLFQLTDNGTRMSNTHEWCAEELSPRIQDLQDLSTADFPELLRRLHRDQVDTIPRVRDLPKGTFRRYLQDGGIQSLLEVPFFVGDELAGFLGFDSVSRERTWTGLEEHMLRIAANSLANALARQRLELQLAHQATHDPLTELLNRRAFEEILQTEASRAERYAEPLALVMLDIDHFKAVNDTYGHGTGDRLLVALTGLVAGRLRGADTMARWGGEEFMIILPRTDRTGARELAEDLRRAVAQADFPVPDRITVSLGVEAHQKGDGLKDLTKRVDDALYAAKMGGRNRVVVAGHES